MPFQRFIAFIAFILLFSEGFEPSPSFVPANTQSVQPSALQFKKQTRLRIQNLNNSIGLSDSQDDSDDYVSDNGASFTVDLTVLPLDHSFQYRDPYLGDLLYLSWFVHRPPPRLT